jgi:hypothetical protein
MGRGSDACDGRPQRPRRFSTGPAGPGPPSQGWPGADEGPGPGPAGPTRTVTVAAGVPPQRSSDKTRPEKQTRTNLNLNYALSVLTHHDCRDEAAVAPVRCSDSLSPGAPIGLGLGIGYPEPEQPVAVFMTLTGRLLTGRLAGIREWHGVHWHWQLTRRRTARAPGRVRPSRRASGRGGQAAESNSACLGQ